MSVVGTEAIWRSPRDGHYEQGGEPCEVVGEDDENGLLRVRFGDGLELWAAEEELAFGELLPPGSLGAAQGALEGL